MNAKKGPALSLGYITNYQIAAAIDHAINTGRITPNAACETLENFYKTIGIKASFTAINGKKISDINIKNDHDTKLMLTKYFNDTVLIIKYAKKLGYWNPDIKKTINKNILKIKKLIT